MTPRRTKLVATLGPSTDPPDVLERVVAAGLDVARMNCSHGTHEDLRNRTQAIREVAAKAGRSVGILFDLQGPKLRLAADTVPRVLPVGETVTVSGRPGADLTVEFENFTALVTKQSELVIGDGLPRLKVLELGEDRVTAEVIARGPVASRKGINVTNARPDLPAMTEKDIADLQLAVELDADFVALSFVRSRADVELLRGALALRGGRARCIAKIEKVEAHRDLDQILEAADGIMVARGDLGIEAGAAAVPLIQKDVIARATEAGKTVITATQMLESMLSSAEPTRAEATDVVNAVIDGTSAVMLSGETSVGAFPAEAAAAMAELARAGDGAPQLRGARNRTGGTKSRAVLRAAVDLAEQLGAAALVIPTQTGAAARECAKYRPSQPIVALAHDERVARQLTLEWGVDAVPFDEFDSVEHLIDAALLAARDEAGVEPGATVVITAGRRTGIAGGTDLLMVREVPDR